MKETTQPPKDPKKKLWIGYAVILAIVILSNLFLFPAVMQASVKSVNYSTFLQMLESKELATVQIEDQQIYFVDKNDNSYKTNAIAQDNNLVTRLEDAGVEFGTVYQSPTIWDSLLNLLIGFIPPVSGKILIDGINMVNLDINEYRHQIAVVPQNTILFSGTILDNIAYGLEHVTEKDVMEVIKDVGLEDMIEKLPDGIYTQLGEHGDKLSGGQRQRISIARALIRKPKIIVFDEATSALDSASEKKVQEATSNMMKNCTTFLVAHRLSTIRNADRIVAMRDGKIVEVGSYDELMEKKGYFYELKALQS